MCVCVCVQARVSQKVEAKGNPEAAVGGPADVALRERKESRPNRVEVVPRGVVRRLDLGFGGQRSFSTSLPCLPSRSVSVTVRDSNSTPCQSSSRVLLPCVFLPLKDPDVGFTCLLNTHTSIYY